MQPATTRYEKFKRKMLSCYHRSKFTVVEWIVWLAVLGWLTNIAQNAIIHT